MGGWYTWSSHFHMPFTYLLDGQIGTCTIGTQKTQSLLLVHMYCTDPDPYAQYAASMSFSGTDRLGGEWGRESAQRTCQTPIFGFSMQPARGHSERMAVAQALLAARKGASLLADLG